MAAARGISVEDVQDSDVPDDEEDEEDGENAEMGEEDDEEEEEEGKETLVEKTPTAPRQPRRRKPASSGLDILTKHKEKMKLKAWERMKKKSKPKKVFKNLMRHSQVQVWNVNRQD